MWSRVILCYMSALYFVAAIALPPIAKLSLLLLLLLREYSDAITILTVYMGTVYIHAEMDSGFVQTLESP